MECINCGEEMSGVGCGDNPNTGYAFNLFLCDYGCSTIMKQFVWKDKGEIWIFPDNTIVGGRDKPEYDISCGVLCVDEVVDRDISNIED